jgi:hypothetical protein
LTLNQVVSLIKVISTSHKKVNHFFFGDVSDWMNTKRLQFPSVRLGIDTFRNTLGGVEVDCEMTFVDLCLMTPEDVNDEDLNANDIEVQSDMLTVSSDIAAVIDNPNISGWMVRGDFEGDIFGQYQFKDGDEHCIAGVFFKFTLFLPEARAYCRAPIDGILQENSAFIISERNELLEAEQ